MLKAEVEMSLGQRIQRRYPQMVRDAIDWLSRAFSFLSSDLSRSTFSEIYLESSSFYTGCCRIDIFKLYSSLLLLDYRQSTCKAIILTSDECTTTINHTPSHRLNLDDSIYTLYILHLRVYQAPYIPWKVQCPSDSFKIPLNRTNERRATNKRHSTTPHSIQRPSIHVIVLSHSTDTD
jgi:hypothetical protein